MSQIKLLCFPYAGGSAVIYQKWKPYLNLSNGVEVVPVELAGRGKRMKEPFYANLQSAVDDLYQQISVHIADGPYALFGHSLGGLLVYELARKIRQENVRQPLHLFFSGKSAPHIARAGEKQYHAMDNEEFRREVINLGGTPPEFFDHPELLNLFVPLLRNDFMLAETNLAGHSVEPFECDISVFLGKEDDEISAEQADAWKVYSKGACALHYFNGGHFFLHHEIVRIANRVRDVLSKHWHRSPQELTAKANV